MVLVALLVLVSALAAPPTDLIELDSGETLLATVVEQNDDVVVIDHPVLGRLTLPAATVKSIRSVPAGTAPPPPAPAAAAVSPPPPRWESSFDIGFTGSAGNTQNTDLRLALNTAYKDPTQSYLVDASYYIRTSSGDTTDNQATAGFLGDWPINESRWSTFAQGRIDYNEFQSWTERFTGGGGLGYLLIDEDTVDATGATVDALTLMARFGLGFRKEWGSLNDEIAAEGIAGLSTMWRISERQKLIGGAVVYPTIAGPYQFRFTINAEWALSLDDMLEGLQLKLGLAYEYQQEIDPGRDHNDLNVYLAMGVKF